MRLLLFTCAVSLLILTACGKNPRDNFDPFKNYGGAHVYFTTDCTAKIGDECVKVSCKRDEASGCADFASGCCRNNGYLHRVERKR